MASFEDLKLTKLLYRIREDIQKLFEDKEKNKFEIPPDIIGGGNVPPDSGLTLTVLEDDGSPTVGSVNTLFVPNNSLVDEGDGVISFKPEKSACIVSFGSGTAVTTGDGTFALTIPAQLDGMNLTDVVCSVYTKGVTGTTDIQIRRRRTGSDADMLTTKITIGDEFFASDEGINASNDDVATGDQIYVDVDAVHSGTAPNGLSTTLTFKKP